MTGIHTARLGAHTHIMAVWPVSVWCLLHGAHRSPDHRHIQEPATKTNNQRAALLFWPFTNEWTVSSSYNINEYNNNGTTSNGKRRWADLDRLGPTWTDLETTLGKRFTLPANEWSVAAQNEKELLTLTLKHTRTRTYGRGNAVLIESILMVHCETWWLFCALLVLPGNHQHRRGSSFVLMLHSFFFHLPFCRNFSLHWFYQ